MTLTELHTILEATGFPVAYSHFKTRPSVPFIAYSVAYSSNLTADNMTYKKISNVDIELYTDKKDLEAENTLETILNVNKIPFQTIENYIDSEKLFQTIYEITII